MDMVELQKSPNQPRWALVVIDIFSKLGDGQPMYKKDSDSVLNALKNIFKKMGDPMSIYSDNGPPVSVATGNIWPGCTKSEGLASGATATWTVRARSAAEIPVSIPVLASMESFTARDLRML